jgi:hypothetical protein
MMIGEEVRQSVTPMDQDKEVMMRIIHRSRGGMKSISIVSVITSLGGMRGNIPEVAVEVEGVGEVEVEVEVVDIGLDSAWGFSTQVMRSCWFCVQCLMS